MSWSVVETHVSWLVMTDRSVLKVKRPVRFGFLDFRSPEARAEACRAEVELNRRLAPDVYQGVGTWVPPTGPAEPVVVMRRLPAERSLTRLLETGAPDLPGQIDLIASVLARFHDRAGRAGVADAGSDAVSRRWHDNLAQLRELAGPLGVSSDLAEIERLGEDLLVGCAGVLDRRVADGRAVDGHGDLLADDIFCLDDGPRILDCLEFDPFLRRGDRVADLASLAAELHRLGRPDLAGRLMDRYAAATGDSWPLSLEDLHVAYRAIVRAKIACIRAAAGDPDAGWEARHLLALALDRMRRGRVRLVLVGGPPGTGKSTVARGLAAATGWPVLGSDRVRRELSAAAGGDPGGRYGPQAKAAVYRALLERAGQVLGSGRSVILDATWTATGNRKDAADLARRWRAELVPLRCSTPPGTAAARVASRPADRAEGSEATAEVARHLAAEAAPWPEAVILDTTGDPGTAVEAARAALGPIHPAPGTRGPDGTLGPTAGPGEGGTMAVLPLTEAAHEGRARSPETRRPDTGRMA